MKGKLPPTPALLVDLDLMAANIRRMQSHCTRSGVALRPHAKSHKCSKIARLQLDAGAAGICCATIGEAEAMRAGGVYDLLMTSPIASNDKLERLAALIGSGTRVQIVADHPAMIARLGAVARGAGGPLEVLVDLDVGHHRTGCTSPAAAGRLARAIADEPGLTFGGLQAYAGHIQHIGDLASRERAVGEVNALVAAARDAIAAEGLALSRITGAGTGTHAIDAASGLFTEIQAGSYIFMDSEYLALELRGGWPFAPSVFVLATVISRNVPAQVTTDAGTKAFATNGPAPIVVEPVLPGATYALVGDEHGRILLPDGVEAPALGSTLRMIVSHCDPTVALHDRYHVLRSGVIVESWAIDGKGR